MFLERENLHAQNYYMHMPLLSIPFGRHEASKFTTHVHPRFTLGHEGQWPVHGSLNLLRPHTKLPMVQSDLLTPEIDDAP
mgnify:CR=1 FL=1